MIMSAVQSIRLTKREKEILKGVVQGYSAREIAVDLGISPRTVEVLRGRLVKKLGARTLPQAVFLFCTSSQNARAL
jgi:two-component system response regulator FixJ